MTRRRGALVAGLFAALVLGASAGSANAVPVVTVNQQVPNPAFPNQEQTGRLFRGGVASTCESPKSVAPHVIDAPTKFHYTNHTTGSNLNHPVCLTVTLSTSCTGTNEIFSVAYVGDSTVGTIDPADPRTRYVADMGDSPPRKTSYSFMAPPRGALIGIVVHETNETAGCSGYTISWSSRGPWADNTPSIQGVAALGTVLTGVDATWKATPAVERRWRRCDITGANCTDIPGATGSTYTVSDADLGHTLRFHNDATDADATNSSESPYVEPFIPFDTRASESLGPGDRAQGGFFVRSGFESRCGATNAPPVVLQQTTSFFYDPFPVASLLNESVCLVARTTHTCGNGVTPSIYNPTFTPASGIQANYAGHSGAGIGLPGLVSGPLPAAESREVVVTRLATTAPCDSYSLTLGANAPFATARPSVGGSPVEGSPLNASDGTWSGTPAFSYGWLRCNAEGATCAPIAGANAATYTPTAADVGGRLRARVTAARGVSVSSDSEPTGIVAAGPDRTAPKGTIRLGSRNLAKAVKSGRVPVVVTCDEACTAVVGLRVTRKLAKQLGMGKKVVIARAKGSVPAGRRKTLKAKLAKRARRTLRRRNSLKLRLAGTFTDRAGNKSKKTAKGTLKRRR